MRAADGYVLYLQVAAGIALVSMGLRFVFPVARGALVIVSAAAVAAAAGAPGMPLWLRAGCLVMAISAVLALLVEHRKTVRRR